jgi:aminopeptidase N
VVASGRRIFKISEDKTNTFHYETKVPIPTKVMVFAAADFNIKNFEKLYLKKQCVPVSSWIYQDSPVKGFDDYKCALSILKFYDSLLGPYSFQKLANVQSNTRFGGMENAGNIFYDENTVDGTKSVENLVAHEVAHQWFGNAVTEKNWRDIWLSEGFATYLTDLYIEHKYGDEPFKKRLERERQKIIKFSHYKQQPIVLDHPKNLFALLNPNSYEKGAWVLHMLRQKIGDKTFFKLLKDFYQDYHLKNASTEDFIQLAQQISQQNLDKFFKQWLYRDDLPLLKINTKLSKKTYFVTIEQLTTPYQLDLPVMMKNKNFSIKRLLKVNKEKQTFSVDLPNNNSEDAIKLIIDPDVQVLFELIPNE